MYQELGHPTFAIFIFWRVIIITVNPEDIKVWSLSSPSKVMRLTYKNCIHVYIVLTTKQLIANCRHILMSPANITGVHSSRGLGVEKHAVITIMA